MSHAALGDRGAEALSHCLSLNRSTKALILNDNRIQPEGVQHILRALLVRNGNVGSHLMNEAPDDPPPTLVTVSKLGNPFKLFEAKVCGCQ